MAVFLACYFSVWSNDFAITDDYPDFLYGTEGTHPEKRVIEGRPLYASIGYALRDLAPEHAGLPVTSSAFDDPSPPQGSLVVDIGKGIAASP